MIGLHAAHLLLIISHQLLPGATYFVILDALAVAAVFAHCEYALNDDDDFYTCPLLLSRSTLSTQKMFPWMVKSSKLGFLECSCLDDLSSRKSGRRRGGQTLGFFDDSSIAIFWTPPEPPTVLHFYSKKNAGLCPPQDPPPSNKGAKEQS
jgi:hypothetical protein